MPISDYLRHLRSMIGSTCVMMPAVSAIIINDAGEVLLHRSSGDGRWYVIGGAPEPGEPPARAAVREAFEETGLIVIPERVIGVYADPLMRYGNGDEVLYTAIAFRCRPVGGKLKIGDDESLEVRYFRPSELPADLLPTHRLRIAHAMSNADQAYFEWDEAWLKNL